MNTSWDLEKHFPNNRTEQIEDWRKDVENFIKDYDKAEYISEFSTIDYFEYLNRLSVLDNKIIEPFIYISLKSSLDTQNQDILKEKSITSDIYN